MRVGLYDGCEGHEELLAYKEIPMGIDFYTDMTALSTAIMSLTEGRQLAGIGVAVAGKVSADRQKLVAAGNLTHWVEKTVVQLLADQFQCVVILGNDAEAAALAEAVSGHGQAEDFLYVIWGTGVGGCFVRHIAGRPHVFAGEVGHVRTGTIRERECGCGHYDCLESLVGGDGLIHYYGKDPSKLTEKVWSRAGQDMARGLHGVLTSSPVPLVVLGGGVASKQPHLVRHVQRNLRETLTMVSIPEVSLSAHGEGGGTLGALSLLQLAA